MTSLCTKSWQEMLLNDTTIFIRMTHKAYTVQQEKISIKKNWEHQMGAEIKLAVGKKTKYQQNWYHNGPKQ